MVVEHWRLTLEGEERKPKLWPLVFRKWLEWFSSNLECGLPYLAGTSVATLVSIGQRITELQRCENRIYFLPVIYSRCGAPASLAERHTTVCLDHRKHFTGMIVGYSSMQKKKKTLCCFTE